MIRLLSLTTTLSICLFLPYFQTAYTQVLETEQHANIEGRCPVVASSAKHQEELKRVNRGEQMNPTVDPRVFPYHIPLTIHICRSDAGSGGLTLAELDTAMKDLNYYYTLNNTGIQFFIYGSIRYINSNYFLDSIRTDAQRNQLLRQDTVTNTINIYFAYLGCGATFPDNDSAQGILMSPACVADRTTFAHEMGHFFNLIHTHEAGNGDAGKATSLIQMLDGNAGVCYYSASEQNLMFARRTSTGGWIAPIRLDASCDVGSYTSLQIINSNPAISYYDATNGNLKFVRALDMSGINWGSPVTVASVGNVGTHCSLQLVNGNPAISYLDVSNYDLKYVRANDATGSSWGAPVTVVSTGIVGFLTSLKIVNGNPAISYYDFDNLSIKLVRATDASGGGWGTPVTAVAQGHNLGYSSLVITIYGNPAISYYDATNHELKYVLANDNLGSSWGTPVVVDTDGDVGQYASLQIVNFNPAISYYDVTKGDLKYVRSTDYYGNSWGTPIVSDSAGNVGQYTSLQNINFKPAISYYDVTNGDLKFVLANNNSGTSWGSPSTIDGGNVANRVEWPDGTNWATTGDYLQDTPADPNVASRVASSPACTMIGTMQAPCGSNSVAYMPSVDNLMGYTDPSTHCANNFTAGQKNRMLAAMAFANRRNLNQHNVKYVDGTWTGSNPNGSPENPFRTVGSAILNTNPGNYIFVRSGTYLENFVTDRVISLDRWDASGVATIGQ